MAASSRIAPLLVHLALLHLTAALHVGIAGATGRTGRLVVQRLLEEGHTVKAIVRDADKARECLPDAVECHVVDLATAGSEAMQEACSGIERLIWCASGFTADGELIDIKAMSTMPKAVASSMANTDDAGPKVIMVSSAGVTRTSWDDETKERLIGASDIPIIRLNPNGILDKKVVAEDTLRGSGVDYCIVRPTGLKFEGWPQGRPILSQGDVAVGRTNPCDLADVVVRSLVEPLAIGKTFEMFTLTGYPAARDIAPVLERLAPDAAGTLDPNTVQATYDVLQQLLPGEEQDATKLEMGRTYEMVDSGVVAPRERGAAPTEREKELAASAAGPYGEGKRGLRGLVSKLFRGS